VLYPLRVADLAYLAPQDRLLAIDEASRCSGWCCGCPEEFVVRFLGVLTEAVDRLHEGQGVFDGLFYDNVTLAGEIVDFEWLYVSGIALPDGSTDEMIVERQQKAGVYLTEIGYQMCGFLGLPLSVGALASIIQGFSPRCENLRRVLRDLEKIGQ
jgi:hypothetical protein